MEDALGGEQGFKGPVSSWAPLARQGTAGAGRDGESKGCGPFSSASTDLSAEKDCRPECVCMWGTGVRDARVGKNEVGKRKEGVFRRQGREECRGKVSPSRAPLPTLAELIWEWEVAAAVTAAPHSLAVRGCCGLGGSRDHLLPAGSPSLTVASSAGFWALRRDQVCGSASAPGAALSQGTCGAPAPDSRRGRSESAEGRRP